MIPLAGSERMRKGRRNQPEFADLRRGRHQLPLRHRVPPRRWIRQPRSPIPTVARLPAVAGPPRVSRAWSTIANDSTSARVCRLANRFRWYLRSSRAALPVLPRHLLQAQLLSMSHADLQSPGCGPRSPSGSSCMRYDCLLTTRATPRILVCDRALSRDGLNRVGPSDRLGSDTEDAEAEHDLK
jgi:hypothetical protein